MTSFGNKFCLKMRSRLIKALNNRFYVKFMQLEIGLLPSSLEILNRLSLILKPTLKLIFNSSILIKVSNWDLKRALDRLK